MRNTIARVKKKREIPLCDARPRNQGIRCEIRRIPRTRFFSVRLKGADSRAHSQTYQRQRNTRRRVRDVLFASVLKLKNRGLHCLHGDNAGAKRLESRSLLKSGPMKKRRGTPLPD